jgi:hypothetical protein
MFLTQANLQFVGVLFHVSDTSPNSLRKQPVGVGLFAPFATKFDMTLLSPIFMDQNVTEFETC